MATRLILPAAYSWQPQTLPQIAKVGLTSELLDAIVPFNGNMAAVPGAYVAPARFTETVVGGVAYSKYGRGRTYNGSTQYSGRLAAPYPLTASANHVKECTMMALVIPSSIATASSQIFAYGNSASSNPLMMLGQGGSAGTIALRVRDTAGADREVNSASSLWANNTPALVIAGRSESQNVTYIYINGALVTSTTAAATTSVSFDRTAVGGLLRSSFALAFQGSVYLAASWRRMLQRDEVAALSANPWQIFDAPSKPIFINTAAGGGATYTLTANQGSYTLTGQAATLTRQANLTAVQGSYTLTGQAAGLTRQAKMTADQGSYALTGQSAGLTRQAVLIAAQGAYALTGQDVTLTYSGAGAPTYTLTAAQGGYTLTGQAAGLTRQAKLTADQGSYSLTGQAALLTRQAKLTAAQGSYTLTGQTVTLTYTPVTGAYTLTAETGYYTLSGQNTGLTYDSLEPESRGSKGGWDPYYYKKRNKRRDKQKDIVEFIEEVATPQLAQAPMVVQLQAKEALEASRLAIEEATAAARQRALVEIAEFYSLVRDAVKRRREEEDEDDLLLLS